MIAWLGRDPLADMMRTPGSDLPTAVANGKTFHQHQQLWGKPIPHDGKKTRLTITDSSEAQMRTLCSSGRHSLPNLR